MTSWEGFNNYFIAVQLKPFAFMIIIPLAKAERK